MVDLIVHRCPETGCVLRSIYYSTMGDTIHAVNVFQIQSHIGIEEVTDFWRFAVFSSNRTTPIQVGDKAIDISKNIRYHNISTPVINTA